MNIWLVNHYAIPPTEVGGTRHYMLARELIKLGHHVTIVASSYDHFARQDTRLAPDEVWKREVIGDVPFVWIRTPAYSGNLARMGNMLVFAARVQQQTGLADLTRPDVIVGSSPHLFAAFAAERLARKLGVPFVLEVRDIWPQSLVEVSGVSPKHPVVLMMTVVERYLYRRADHILTLLPGSAAHMVANGAAESKITWLPNGVDLDLCPAIAPLPPEPPFTVLYAGSHGIANGLDAILDAAAILKREGVEGVSLRFLGQGPEKARLQARARDEGLDNVRFDDPVPKSAVYGVLGEAHAFIVTMRNLDLYKHGISFNKIYDYLAAGRPTVFGSNAANNPVDEAQAGLSVPPEDAAAMAGAIRRLMAMTPEARTAMGLAGRRYVEAHFAFSRLAARMEGALLRVTR